MHSTFVLLVGILVCQGSFGAFPMPTAVSDFFTAQNAKDCTAWVDLFAPKFSVEDPKGSTPITTKTALRAGCEQTNQLFRSVNLIPFKTEAYPVGDGGAAVRWRSTNVAVVNGTTCQLDFTGVDVFETAENGTLITSMHGYFNADIPSEQLKPCLG